MKESPSVSARWRADAVVLRRYGCRRIASILEHCADEIDKEIGQDRYVDLAEAKALTGYTRGHLRRLMRGNTLPNHGTEAAPRFLVSELPRKPGLQRGAVPGAASAGMTRSEAARAVIGRTESGGTRSTRRRNTDR